MGRLSGLPDDLILKILSFVGLKDDVGTCVLSPKWRHLWTSIPHLSFSSDDFSTMDKFCAFVTHVLSQMRLTPSSDRFYLRLEDSGQDVAQWITNRASALGVQQVNVMCLFGHLTCFSNKDTHILSLSSSSLKRLTLTRDSFYDRIALTSTHELPSLTTLHLDHITLSDAFFSNYCPNLASLNLNSCRVITAGSPDVLRISHSRISSLTLYNGDLYTDTIDVVAPQLKNLTIA